MAVMKNLALAERVAKERHLRTLAEAISAYEKAFGKITAAELGAQEHADRRNAAVRPRKRRKIAAGFTTQKVVTD